jgi:type I protein arginine methyltransferase
MASFGDIKDGQSSTENPFTQFYGTLLHQGMGFCCVDSLLANSLTNALYYSPHLTGNMLADYVRTGTYQKAFVNNSPDFEGKVVLDVGTGTGILSFFALQAGAQKVYAIDASDSVLIAKKLADANGYGNRIVIIKGKIEEVELPEKVDIIVSEPIGFLLVHERMLESFVVARDRFLKPGGLMMPTTGSIVICPFSDQTLYREQCARAAFWDNDNFYGLDLSSVLNIAHNEFFSQAVVGKGILCALHW